MIKKISITILLFVCLVCRLQGQEQIAIKTNLLHDLTTTLNLGVELSVASDWTVDLSIDYNPWTFSGNKKFKHWLLQPEVRYWTDRGFQGHFFGAHLLAGGFNMGGIRLLGVKNERRQGYMYGIGLGYGYRWLFNTHWGMEAEVGLGYIYNVYDRYPCGVCGERLGEGHKNYLGPTRVALSLIYRIR